MPACRENTSFGPSRSCWEKCPFNKKYYRWYNWNQDQAYEGEFFRGYLHGEGTYKWKDFGVYEGSFYSNYKEGYATLSFPDNSCFEGLFVRNERFGPGVFTHPNGRQDVGFWKGGKLVRLSRAVDFIIPRLAPTSSAKIKLLQFRRLIPIDEDVCSSFIEIYNMCDCPSNFLSCPYSSLIFDPRSFFFDKPTFEKTYFLNFKQIPEELLNGSDNWEVVNQVQKGYEDEEEQELQQQQEIEFKSVPSHCQCEKKEFVMKYQKQTPVDVCENDYIKSDVEMGILAYFSHYNDMESLESKDEDEMEGLKEFEGIGEVEEKTKQPKILAWNRSELCTLMLQQIFRYRAFEGKLTFNIAKLILGARTAFRKTGEKEKQCLEFLRACATGPPQTVKAMLCNYDVSEELTDSRGNNSVMFAAATDQREIIDILTDNGVDVNSFNDESLTPLNLCLLRRLAQGFNLGNWETAFLPKEIQITDDLETEEEWRKRVSIASLDRILGDGKSMNEPLEPHVCESSKERDPNRINSKSLVTMESSSMTAIPTMTKSLYNTVTLSMTVKSESLAMPDPQIPPKTQPKIQSQILKTEEFAKSVNYSSEGSYFFELAPQKLGLENGKDESLRQFWRLSDEEEENGECEEFLCSEEKEKMLEIDKTIEKLLKRGADPNLSEAPKPSIHLGVYTKDLKIIQLLLSYGANPNSQLHSNEGLLTPLHVLVLLRSALEYVDICNLLLNFGADPEEKTLPQFAFYEDEKPFLDPMEGRTPLQLLCMRPDLEYADPEGNLIKIALMLASVCNKTSFYKGYSYLAIAMCFGNLKLLKALLDSNCFDPNILLGNDMGTILHVLVSTEFQKKTLFDTSIQICDYLLDAKANPLKRISQTGKLAGNCIDYGYREIDSEKASRIIFSSDKKDSGKKGSDKKGSKKTEKPEKSLERDHLIDHIKVMEYLCKRVEGMKLKKKQGKSDKTDDRNIQDKNKSTRLTSRFKPNKEEGDESALNKEQNLALVEDDKKVIDIKIEKGENGLKNEKNEFEKSGDLFDDMGKRNNDYDNDDDAADDDETKGKKKGLESKNKNGKKKKDKNFKLKGSEKAEKGKLDSKETMKKTESNLSKLKLKSSLSKPVTGKQSCHSETLPERLRQSILKLLGNCTALDVNELLLPYVVLRDGNLYYSLKEKTSRGKEQYSLV